MLWLIDGDVGSGKSLIMTILAYLSSQKYVFANFNLRIPNKEIKKFSLDDMFTDELSEGDVFLDEVYTLVDSRNSMSNYNKALSYILFQSRKKGLNIFNAMQLPRSIDVRFREMANYIIKCESNDKGFIYHIYRIKQHKVVSYRKLSLKYNVASYFFTMFDTKQIITSEKVDNLKQKVYTKEKIQEIIDKHIEPFKKYLSENDVKFSKDSVKFYCRKHNLREDSEFINALYLELKFAGMKKVPSGV